MAAEDIKTEQPAAAADEVLEPEVVEAEPVEEPQEEPCEEAQREPADELAQAKAEAGEIVKAADRTAAAHSEEILEDARRQAQAMLAKAEADIAQQRKKAVNEVKDELGGIAVDIASKVVEREVRPEDHAKLIDEFIQNVGDAS